MSNNFIKKNYKGFLIVLLGFLFLIGWASWKQNGKEARKILNFEECIASYTSIPTRPAQCWTPEGGLFIDYTFDDPRLVIDIEKDWMVEDGTLTISGQVVGFWFFEASFLAELWNSLGQKFSSGLATAEDEWMTEELVPFSVSFSLSDNYSEDRVTLVLIKDNPSGLPEHDDVLAVPIKLVYRASPE